MRPDPPSQYAVPPGDPFGLQMLPDGDAGAPPAEAPAPAGRWGLPERWQARLPRLRVQAVRAGLFGAGVVAAFLALVLYQALFPPPPPLTQHDVTDSIAAAMASATPAPAFSEGVYQVIQPSLVLIQAQLPGKDGQPEQDLGSGVIVNDQGDILTSLHVVTQATEIKLTFADGSESPGQIATAQPEQDIAVLHAAKPPAQLVPATLGSPGAMRVGDEAYVVGNPFGLYSSMSAGVISGFGRAFQPVGSQYKLQDLIQIDAAVNPGNSGGPLLNRYGEVIGIVTGLVNPTAQNFFVGVGFAVPITTAGGAAGAPQY
ncbi:MAG TPA: trypsin-like peptidase domain-containing protein [Chloroflexia bacterium]|nr:trypsin-like peptidase domain-containing protein [Chloroflexia bacterium]